MARFFVTLAALAVLASSAMAGQVFLADFNADATEGTVGTAPAFGGGQFVAGYGTDGTNRTANTGRTLNGVAVTRYFGIETTTTGNLTGGWAWEAPSTITFDAKTDVFFVRRVMINDVYSKTGGIRAGANADVLGSSSPDLFANASNINSDASNQMFYHYYSTATGLLPAVSNNFSNNATQTTDAARKAIVDGLQTMTWVVRDQDATNMTIEMNGANATKKSKIATPAGGVFNKFSGVKPTPTYSRLNTTDTVLSNFATATGKIQVGDVRYEVGLTKQTDFNFDYATDTSDYNVLLANMGTGGTNLNTMAKGDATNDGYTDTSDYNAVLANMGNSHDIAFDANGVEAKYNNETGKMTITVPATVGLNSIVLYGPEAISTTFTTNDLVSAAPWAQAGGGFWVQNYFNGKEQWAKIFGLSLTGATEMEIATYATGLTAAQLTQLEYSATIGGVTSTFFAPVTIVPEPATMSLLVLGGLGLLARRRK